MRGQTTLASEYRTDALGRGGRVRADRRARVGIVADEVRARGEPAVVAQQMGPGPRHPGGEACDEVFGLEQDVGGAVAERAFELEHHQRVAVDAQARLGGRRSAHLAAYALEFAALVGLAGDRAV